MGIILEKPFTLNSKTTVMSQTIKIFLASSAELKEDREQFEQFIGRKIKRSMTKGGF
ncbi:hypothetical protein HUU05_29730 [candidate division KSB1 bacterium]|nr:hypothetical protein [candidate division KSB1 bacterium]